ncbi:unnamed protein product [Protopolystoma xenopodis]|uniref:Uncharacterized protein n=1 Tax=Protopolystoma xenopodis TaxID=117903 RepID=A0A3S4ZR11_9PLAT|nr:unnamed protein product [Protopolystoma xenopodis]
MSSEFTAEQCKTSDLPQVLPAHQASVPNASKVSKFGSTQLSTITHPNRIPHLQPSFPPHSHGSVYPNNSMNNLSKTQCSPRTSPSHPPTCQNRLGSSVGTPAFPMVDDSGVARRPSSNCQPLQVPASPTLGPRSTSPGYSGALMTAAQIVAADDVEDTKTRQYQHYPFQHSCQRGHLVLEETSGLQGT